MCCSLWFTFQEFAVLSKEHHKATNLVLAPGTNAKATASTGNAGYIFEVAHLEPTCS